MNLAYNMAMIILTGPSASGKTEIAKILCQKYHICKVITHTTRPIRKTELEDVDYHFVTEDTFLRLKTEHAFVETTLYNGYQYGTAKTAVGDHKVLIVDPNGLRAFTALNNPRFVTFYIDTSDVTRLNRMIMRGQDLGFAKTRLAWDQANFERKSLARIDYEINNERITIEEASDQIFKLYQDHLSQLHEKEKNI